MRSMIVLLIYLHFLYSPPKNIVSKSVAAYKNTESTMVWDLVNKVTPISFGMRYV